jgi:ATP-dependent helicase/nuclease subunit B
MTLPTEHDSANAVQLLMGGRIDRVDIYRAEDGETVYVRVVDYKSSHHEFTVKSVTEDMNVQLLLYLFTLCSPQNRALFADAEGRVPTRVLPASMVYISPKESTREGALLPCRSGVVLGDPEILRAVENHPDPETTFLPSASRNKKGEITGKGLYSAEQMADLEGILRSAILDTAATMYDGCAYRTPSEEACRYCRVRGSCGVYSGQ